MMPIDLTRSILVVLIPGAVAICPWLLFIVLHTDATLGYNNNYDILANALVFAIVTISGITCESIGTHIEVMWDKERESSHLVKANWYAYLAHKLDPEPIGYKYLSRLATMMYFELAMLVAIAPFSLGAAFLVHRRFDPTMWGLFLVTLSLMLLALRYFYWNAKTTHEVLCKTRMELNARWDPANASAYKKL